MGKTKFVEPIKETMLTWVAPDGSIQPAFLAPDLPTMLGYTKLLSQKGASQTAKELVQKGFTIHVIKVDMESVEQIQMNGELMSQLLNL